MASISRTGSSLESDAEESLSKAFANFRSEGRLETYYSRWSWGPLVSEWNFLPTHQCLPVVIELKCILQDFVGHFDDISDTSKVNYMTMPVMPG